MDNPETADVGLASLIPASPKALAKKPAKKKPKAAKKVKKKAARKTTVTAKSRRSGVDLRKVFGTGKKPKKPKAAKKVKKKGSNQRPVVLTERLDMRLTKGQKAKLNAKAKKLKRTITSLVQEAIDAI